jgi:outer membrane immunogenic protein
MFLMGVLASAPAFANDVIMDVAPSTTNWSGVYVEAFAGGVHSDANAYRTGHSGALLTLDVQNGLFPDTLRGSHTALTGGLGAGYLVQKGRFVGGIEADIAYVDSNFVNRFSKVDPNPMAPFTGVDTNTTYESRFGLVGSAKLRGGIALGDTMLYANGGIAAGQVTNRFSLEIPQLAYTSPDWSERGTRIGFVLGGGIEQKLGNGYSIKIEGSYINLADTTVYAADPTNFPGQTVDYRFSNDLVIGRVGFAKRF